MIHPIFQQCCADEGGKYGIDKPFVQRGYLYATDGRIVVRMKSTEASDNGMFPACHDLPWNAEYESEPIEIGDIPEPWKVGCGNAEDHHLFNEDDGDMNCPECGGTGLSQVEIGVEVAKEIGLGIGYLWKLRAHGALIFAPINTNHTRPVCFKIGENIEGLLMRRRIDGCVKISDLAGARAVAVATWSQK